MQPQGRTK